MHLTRLKFWILAFLLVCYLAGILLLSAVSLHESRNNENRNFNYKPNPEIIQYLPPKNKNSYVASGFRPILRRYKIILCSELDFLDPPIRPIALASFPGSGNTWLRYLLQQATGYYTGSVYKDYGLLKNGFPAESVTNGSVLVVKTHEWGPNARNPFSKAILLVRQPKDAIQAEFNRQSGGHIGFALPDRYKRTKGRHWQQFVNDKLKGWQQLNYDWLYNFSGPTHVVFYEDLVHNTEKTLRSVIDFIGVPVDGDQFNCAIERKEGIYRRKKKALGFDPFTVEMKERIGEVEKNVYNAIYSSATAKNRKKS